MTHSLPLPQAALAIAGCMLLAAMMVATLIVLQRLQRRDRMRARIRAVTAPFQRRTAAAAAVSPGVALARVSQGASRVIQQSFGFNLAIQDHYVLRWWLALLITLAAAVAVERLAASLIGPITLLCIPPLWLLFSRSFFAWCDGRKRDKLYVQFPDALAMIVRSVRVGIPVTDAIRAVARDAAAPTAAEFTRVANELAIGGVLDEALLGMAERTGLLEYRFFATTLTLQRQTGGALGETLENLADVIRKRVAVRQRGQALSAEAKTSAVVLALLPPIAGLALWILSPDYVLLLITDPMGRKILAAAAISLLFGGITMRTLIRLSLS